MIYIIGLGFVGSAMYKSFTMKGLTDICVYDKYKDGGIGSLDNLFNADIIFLALPTHFNASLNQYDKSAIYQTCDLLTNYQGTIVIKSTIEPETTKRLSEKYVGLHFIHNPEFLTARTAFEDFHHQTHIVLGQGPTCPPEKMQLVYDFYHSLYPEATISRCSSLESESMKLFCNSFYAVKIQFFTELYLLCQKNNCDFNTIRHLMIQNGWINPMHTQIPGPDGSVSYGGLCFPKDTLALNAYMKSLESPNQVLNSTIAERNLLRNDHTNCNL